MRPMHISPWITLPAIVMALSGCSCNETKSTAEATTTSTGAGTPATGATNVNSDAGKILKEETKDGQLVLTVQGLTRELTISGPAEEPAQSFARYWAAFSAADIEAMKREHWVGYMLSEATTRYPDAGSAQEYKDQMIARDMNDPITAVTVKPITDGTTVHFDLHHSSGTVATRYATMANVDGTWKVERIGR